MEGSNRYHKEFQDHHQLSDKSDWYKHNRLEQSFYEDKGCEEKEYNVKPDQWSFGIVERFIVAQNLFDPEKKNLRNVVYVCMKPRSCATDANLRKKKSI